MKINGSIALVTGANRGIGLTFAEELLKRGAAKVYVAARDLSSLAALLQRNDARLVPIRLDVTDEAHIAAAAAALPDVNLLINNAGIAGGKSAYTTLDMAMARKEMDVNYFGMLSLTHAFAPALKAAGGGTIINVLSIASLVTLPAAATYSASKAAALSATRSLRFELAAQHTAVIAVMPAQVDTDMGRALPPPHLSTMDVVGEALDAVESGLEEVFPGDITRTIAQAFAADPKAVQTQFAQQFMPR
jgi:NAD(P)-dependent dehydrogenase (short-subunit alcohol dehydrogenase family)